jgi:hypothetical protein
MQRLARYGWLFAALALWGVVLGCGSGAKSPIPLKKVTGSVTIDGQPLEAGTITFMPVTGTNSSTGEIVQGKFTLSTFSKDDGAPAGDYKVAVMAWATPPEMGVEGVPAIPKHYFDANTSGLTATVSEDAKQEIPIALTH